MPTIKPVITGMGTAVAGTAKVTPARKTMASIPSRKTVMKGKINIAYFSLFLLNREPFAEEDVFARGSIAFDNLTRHLSCSLPTLRRATPIKVMMMEAKRANEPS